MVDGVLLFIVHLAAVWVAWFVVIMGVVLLVCVRDVIVDGEKFPQFEQIADMAFWIATIISGGYALTKTPISLVCWMLNL